MSADAPLKTNTSLRVEKIARMRNLLGNAVRSLAAIERELMDSKILVASDVMALASQCALTRLVFSHLEKTFGDNDLMTPPIRYRHEEGVPDE